MSALDCIQTKPSAVPARVMIYGPPGVGKTSLGASADRPIILPTEDGLGKHEVPHFPIIRSYNGLMEAIGGLYSEEHDFATVVLDSLDWAEALVLTETCKRNGWPNIEAPGYGKGYIAALDVWRELLAGFDALRNERNMLPLLICHSEIKRFDSPEHDPYDRYQPKLQTRANALVQEFCDCIFFIGYRTSVLKSDAGFGKKTTRAVGSGERVIYTEERPAFIAKNRFSLPAQLALDWKAFTAAMAGGLNS